MEKLLLGLVIALEIVASLSYIVSILKGVTKPHRVTRFVLLVVLALNFLSVVAANGNVGSLTLGGIFVAQSLIIFVLSIRRGMGGASLFDITCLLVAIVGVIGWKLTNNPLVGIIFAIAADQIAYLPAMVKTWKYPNTESPWFYILGAVAAAISLISYEISMASAFQIFIVVNCLSMVLLIYRKQLGWK